MFVYFVQEEEAGPIKIGHSGIPPEERLAQLQTGNPRRLRLLGLIETGAPRALEATLHRQFAAWRLGGEWFEPVRELLELIAWDTQPGLLEG